MINKLMKKTTIVNMYEADTHHNATVFVIDDDENICKSLERLIRSAGYRVEVFTSASAFLDRPAYHGTGCLLLDVNMPGMTGPELHDRLVTTGSSIPMIFLTAHGDIPTGVQAIKKGAMDFLLKPVDDEILLQAIASAVKRHASIQNGERKEQEIDTRLARLSHREREVLEYVIGGCLNKQIAAALGISEKTVKVHRARVMEKMEVRSVAELVRLCDSANLPPRRIEQ